MIQAVRYDKKTTAFDPKEELYWLHFLSKQKKDPIVGSYIANQLRANPQFRRDILQQPVCARCECFAFHHKNGIQCSSCGHWEPAKTNKVKDHIKGGMYK